VRIVIALATAAVVVATAIPSAQTDLDRLMAGVLTRRDENWKKLQQYTLVEDQTFRVMGPMETPLFGTHREFVWLPREGFFVRSPLRIDGVTISEAERRREEDAFLEHERQRERRKTARSGQGQPASPDALEVSDVIRQSVQPEFVSAAYFLKFKFEPGHYALAGRERLLDRDVLRIEYYPERLFQGGRRGGRGNGKATEGQSGNGKSSRTTDAQIERQMDKVSFVTLWVEPTTRQILQYEFQNVDADFLPARWLARLDELRASMRMGNPFPDVWLPASLALRVKMTLAIGSVDATYDVTYRDHRLAETSVKVVP
jgi:hypothetical protein